jgi:hypothetical protein
VHRPHANPAARPPRELATIPPTPLQTLEARAGRIDPATMRLLVRYGELMLGLADELEAERAAAAVGGGGPEVKVATSGGQGVAGRLDRTGSIGDRRVRRLEGQVKAARERLRRTVEQLEVARGLREPPKGKRDTRGRLAILVSNPHAQ